MAYEWSKMKVIEWEEVAALHNAGKLAGYFMLYPENNTESQIEKDYDWGEIQRHYANGGMFGREADIAADEDFVSGRLVKRAVRRIHNAGGCGAEDDYSRGYDEAIELALNILLEETGYGLEDILEYTEDREDEDCE